MSQENVELARQAIGDLRFLFDLFDENIVWENVEYAPVGQEGVFHGKAAITRSIRSWVGTWDDYTFEVEELIEAGDSVVLAVRETGRGKGSGIPMEHRYAHVWTFREGRIVWGAAYPTKGDALRDQPRAADRS